MGELERPIKHLLREPQLPVDSLWRDISARRERREWRPLRSPAFVLAIGGVFALAVLAVVQLVPKLEGTTVAGPLRRANGELLRVLDTTDGGAALVVALSDGSSIHVDAGSKLVPRHSDAQLFRASVSRGRVVFDVRPNGPRRWVIEAGDTRVEVIGTRFSVQHDAGGVTVAVEQGRVGVRGPRVPQGAQSLGQGERLVVPPLMAAAPVVERQAEPDPAARLTPLAAPASPRPKARPTVDALLEDADAARLAGEYRRAERVLQRILDDHPSDARVAIVALTLGRLQLDKLRAPKAAAASFTRADRLGLPDALAEEGAARIVEAHAKAGEKALARAAAKRYRERFPQGPRSADVAAWIESD